MTDTYDELEQMDFIDDEHLDKVIDKYSPWIGLFLIEFSCLEHELNVAIADIFHDDCHETGYVIIEKLSIRNKIDLFNKMCTRIESFRDKKYRQELDKIIKQFVSMTEFRNSIVHATWQSITKDGFVRTKIMVDNQEGYVKFKKTQITPKIIREKIKEINKLIDKIFEYKEALLQF